MFWILALLLTALVTAFVLWPLLQRGEDRVAAGRDVDVYAAQLAELDADVKRGAIAPEDAGTARAEIGRRLLRAASATPGRVKGGERRWVVALGVLAVLGLPASALALYAHTGSPQRPDMPLAARQSGERNIAVADGGSLSSMVAAAEARLAENPQDGRGWDVLAPIYAQSGDLERAEAAYRNALALLGESAHRLTGYGEVQVRRAGGEVTDGARAAFARANELDPDRLVPRLFLALDATQEGRMDEAAAGWTALLAEAPQDAPWRGMAEAALAQAEGRAPDSSGPSPAEIVERAAAVPAEAQDEMIEGMVAGLASRLEAQPNDAEGWARLVQAYGVLGDEAAGQAALERARAVFGTQTEEWARIADVGARAGFVVSSGARP